MDDNEKRILEAMKNGNVGTVDEMLTSKIIDPNQIIHGRCILSHAVKYDDLDIVTCLIGHGADVSHNNFEALNAALSTKEVSMVEIIVEAIKSIGIEEVMIEAVFGTGSLERTISGRKYMGSSAFMSACLTDGSDEIVRLFLDLIKDDNISLFKIEWFLDDIDLGTGPFHWSYKMELDTLDALIEKLPFAHELVNLKDKFGYTPLHILTVVSGYGDLKDHVKLMITKGLADPNTASKRGGMSTLHSSVVNKYTPMTKVLLRAGCRTDIFDKRGESPLKIALRMKRRKEIELLLAFGVDLQNEPYLYDEVEMPDRFKGEAFAKHRDSSKMHPDFLTAMKTLCQWNHVDESPGFKNINSLQRMCRKAIRDHYKPNADDVISAMENMPPGMKSYLLMENEEEVLASLVDWK